MRQEHAGTCRSSTLLREADPSTVDVAAPPQSLGQRFILLVVACGLALLLLGVGLKLAQRSLTGQVWKVGEGAILLKDLAFFREDLDEFLILGPGVFLADAPRARQQATSLLDRTRRHLADVRASTLAGQERDRIDRISTILAGIRSRAGGAGDIERDVFRMASLAGSIDAALRGSAADGMERLETRRTTFRAVSWAALLTGIVLLGCAIRWGIVNLVRPLGHLAEVNRDLARARDAAEVAVRTQRHFLANVSHEIRTPMTAIIGYADMLASEEDLDRGPSHRVEAIRAIAGNGNHLLTIINDLLDLSKIEAGQVTLEEMECPPAELVSEVITLMQGRARGKELALDIECATAIPGSIRVDPTRLRQVLVNLLDNAIKFTDEGRVDLVLRLEQDRSGEHRLFFSVRDTGIGMTAVQLQAVFEPFTQADASTTRRYGGTGLGLPICRRLVECMGGTLEASSLPGRGSKFTFHIPVGPLHGVSLVKDIHAVPDPVKPVISAVTAGNVTGSILLAEDGAESRRLFNFLLQDAGMDVTCAVNGSEAVDMAIRARDEGRMFDVVLMDIQMPVMDGHAATGWLRERHYEGPILALTANSMAGDRERCLEAGCDDYIVKPIGRDLFIEKVRRWVTIARSRRAAA